jgi:hypothetical protein
MGGAGDGNRTRIASLDWAPIMTRTSKTLASATGNSREPSAGTHPRPAHRPVPATCQHKDADQARTRADELITGLGTCLIPEVVKLGRTLHVWHRIA